MSKDEGYIKVFRSLLGWRWFNKPETLSTFIYLLLTAKYTDTEWQGITIKRGQIITKYPEICTNTGLSVAQVRTSIKRLKSTGEITHQTTNQYSLITITNYDLYQGIANSLIDSRATDEQQANDSRATDEHTNNKKNIKKVKKDKKYIYEQKNAFFDSFWCSYPKKKNKIRAFEVFNNLNVTEELLQVILIAIEKQKLTEEWRKENGRFIPYPETWLKYHRWEDEISNQPKAIGFGGVMFGREDVSFDVELAERQAKERLIDFGSKKNPRRRKKGDNPNDTQ